MEVCEHSIPYHHRGDVFTFWLLGDIHAGVRACDESLLDRTIEKIKQDENARWFGLGDYGEYINVHDRRFDLSQLAPWMFKKLADAPLETRKQRTSTASTIAGLQRDWLVAKLSPIEEKCLGLTKGNHEETLRLQFENETAHHLAALLNVRNLGYCSYNRLQFTRQTGETSGGGSALVVYIHHGYFTGRRPGALANNLEMMFVQHPQADVIVVGHAHKRLVVPCDAWDITWRAKQPVGNRMRYAILSGPFKRAYSLPGETPTWEERKGFPLSPLGAARFTYKPDGGLIEASA